MEELAPIVSKRVYRPLSGFLRHQWRSLKRCKRLNMLWCPSIQRNPRRFFKLEFSLKTIRLKSLDICMQ